jgi:hypothetical protein
VQSLLDLFEDQVETVTGFVDWIFNTLKPKYTPPKPVVVAQPNKQANNMKGKNMMDEFAINNDIEDSRPPVRKVSNGASGSQQK